MTAHDEGDRLSEEELVNFGVTLLVAGHETTANQLGNFIYTLLSNPERLAELRADPDLVPAAAYFRLANGKSTAAQDFVEPDELVVDAAESCPMEAILVRDGDGVVIAPEV